MEDLQLRPAVRPRCSTLCAKRQGGARTNNAVTTSAGRPHLIFDHCRAQQLTDDQRGALAAYFAVYKGQEEGLAKMFLSVVDHPFVSRAYDVLAAAWQEVRFGIPMDSSL